MANKKTRRGNLNRLKSTPPKVEVELPQLSRVILFTLLLAFGCLHFFLGSKALTVFSPTYDEPVHMTAGYVYLKTADYTYNGYHHPPFGEMISALPLLILNPVLPTQHPAWIKHVWGAFDQYRFADTFLYKNILSPVKMLAFGRAMQLLLSCLLVVMVSYVAYTLGGLNALVLAGGMALFFPGFLAAGTIVSTDMAFAFSYFGFWVSFLFWDRKTGPFLSGLMLALCFSSKYFAIALFPVGFALVFIYWKNVRWNWKQLAVFIGSAVISILIVYQFNGIAVFWDGLLQIFKRSQDGRSSYYLGKHGVTGWLGYFPFSFIAKTPEFLLVSCVVLLLGAVRRNLKFNAVLWMPPVVFFALACISKVQIGHRHILAIYPFLIVMGAVAIGRLVANRKFLLFPLFILSGIGTVLGAPHYLAYFNSFFGGPSKGYTYLTDSNVDWGQGLKLLGDALTDGEKENGIYLSYFGVADPSFYGIRYANVGSDQIVERLGTQDQKPLKPTTFAISVTNLQGTYYSNHHVFDWLKSKSPDRVIAYSIFVYDLSNDPESILKLESLRS